MNGFEFEGQSANNANSATLKEFERNNPVYFFGQIDYIDTFEDKHWIKFRYKYHKDMGPSLKMIASKEGNQSNGINFDASKSI